MFSALSGSISSIYNEVRQEVTAAGSTREFIGALKKQLREDAGELTTQLQEDVTVFLAPKASPSNSNTRLQSTLDSEDSSRRRYTQPRPKAGHKSGGYFKDLRHTLEKQKSVPGNVLTHGRRQSYTQNMRAAKKSLHGPRGSFDDLTSVYKSEDEIEAVHMELVHTGARFLPEEIIAANFFRRSQMRSDELISKRISSEIITTIDEHKELAPSISVDGLILGGSARDISSPAPQIKLKKKRVVRRLKSPAGNMQRSHSSSDLANKHRNLGRNESSESLSVSRSPHMSTDSLNAESGRTSRGPQPRPSAGKIMVRKKVSLSVGGDLQRMGTDPIGRKGSGAKKALPAPVALRCDSTLSLNQDNESSSDKQVKKDLAQAEKDAQDALYKELQLMEEESRASNNRRNSASKEVEKRRRSVAKDGANRRTSTSKESAGEKVSGFLNRLVRSRSGSSGNDEHAKSGSEENLGTANVVKAINEEMHDSAFQESGEDGEDEHVQVPQLKSVTNGNGTNTVPMSVFS